MLRRFKTNHQIGTAVSVEIDYTNNTISRTFKENSITVNGSKSNFRQSELDIFFNNEVYWLDKLESEWIPETIEIDTSNRTIVQRFYQHSLLEKSQRIDIDQLIEMFRFFKAKRVYKCNNSLSNLTINNGQLIAFDFKWAAERPLREGMEIYSYNKWMSKIHPKLPLQLIKLIG